MAPFLAPFSANRPIRLVPVENGGWLVQSDDGDPRTMPHNIGAFSNANDMMGALSSALIPLSNVLVDGGAANV